MAAKRKFTDTEIELLINLWHNEPSLWDSSQLIYSNADARKTALNRIGQQLGGLDGGIYVHYM
jgi:hypothetical protein